MEERRKAVHMLVLDVVMVYVAFAAPRCSVCLVEYAFVIEFGQLIKSAPIKLHT